MCNLKKNICLTRIEESILLGCLLGDGHIEKRGNSYRFKVRHCEKQSEYVKWKYQQLKRLCNKEPKLIKNGKDGSYLASYFNSKSGLYLKFYHNLFYDAVPDLNSKKTRYQKVISPQLIRFLPKSGLLLAVWFMDDGHCRTDCIGGRLATDCFSKTEVCRLQIYLLQTYHIKTNLVCFKNQNKKAKQKIQYYLSISSRNNNFNFFIKLIKPTVSQIPCMTYKIQMLNQSKI